MLSDQVKTRIFISNLARKPRFWHFMKGSRNTIMPRQTKKIRLDQLVSYIQTQTPTRLELLTELYNLRESGRRMFQRDLEELRLEYEIELDGDGRYYLPRTTATTRILSAILSKEEQVLLSRVQQEFQTGHPYASDVSQLLSKLAGQLNQQMQRLDSSTPLSYFGPYFARDYSRYRPLIETLEQAIRQQQKIQFIYTRPVSRSSEEIPHHAVEPQSVGVRNGVFYLYGYNPKMSRVFPFRLDKIKELRVLPQKFATLRKPELVEFEYLLHTDLVKGGISERFHQQELLEILSDGRAHVKAKEEEFWIIQEMLRLGQKVELLSPLYLRQRLAQEIKVMMSYYAGDEV